MIIWGKRTYGAVNKVGNIAVKTVFGHLYFLPLIPMTSYYVDSKSEAAFELNNIHLRSVLCGYIRVWAALMLLLVFLLGFQAATPEDGKLVPALLMGAAALAIIASYVVDKKMVDVESEQVRQLMQRYFGVALDPYECATSLQMEINSKMQSTIGTQLDEYWYKRVLNDPASSTQHVELALLRARCDQHDKPLQQSALQKLPRRTATV